MCATVTGLDILYIASSALELNAVRNPGKPDLDCDLVYIDLSETLRSVTSAGRVSGLCGIVWNRVEKCDFVWFIPGNEGKSWIHPGRHCVSSLVDRGRERHSSNGSPIPHAPSPSSPQHSQSPPILRQSSQRPTAGPRVCALAAAGRSGARSQYH